MWSMIICVSINIVITVAPGDNDFIQGKNPVKDIKLQINKKWTNEINADYSVLGEKPVEEAGLLGEGRRRDQESCIF